HELLLSGRGVERHELDGRELSAWGELVRQKIKSAALPENKMRPSDEDCKAELEDCKAELAKTHQEIRQSEVRARCREEAHAAAMARLLARVDALDEALLAHDQQRIEAADTARGRLAEAQSELAEMHTDVLLAQ
ncbi:unnamed protein product, partial [Polarella glacialis]